ncbi:hypothetical protein ACIF6L_34880 [Kitasatospora sp. NPDC086009]|uniref:hypothetical protein n=1 Tax=unclassified Kitasatospora TaxID=2633591 RepID=UPI0037CB3E2B
MTTAPTRRTPEWRICAIDVSRSYKVGEDPSVPGTEFTADTREELETHLPRIRAILADLAEGWGIPLSLLRIVAVEYHGVRVAGTVNYPSTNAQPDNDLARLRDLTYELTPGVAA